MASLAIFELRLARFLLVMLAAVSALMLVLELYLSARVLTLLFFFVNAVLVTSLLATKYISSIFFISCLVFLFSGIAFLSGQSDKIIGLRLWSYFCVGCLWFVVSNHLNDLSINKYFNYSVISLSILILIRVLFSDPVEIVRPHILVVFVLSGFFIGLIPSKHSLVVSGLVCLICVFFSYESRLSLIAGVIFVGSVLPTGALLFLSTSIPLGFLLLNPYVFERIKSVRLSSDGREYIWNCYIENFDAFGVFTPSIGQFLICDGHGYSHSSWLDVATFFGVAAALVVALYLVIKICVRLSRLDGSGASMLGLILVWGFFEGGFVWMVSFLVLGVTYRALAEPCHRVELIKGESR